MAAYIYYDSISKPRFRSDLPRPIDALKLFDVNQYNSLSIVGQAGIEAVKNGNNPAEFEIFHNRKQMLTEQDFIVFVREGAPVAAFWAAWGAWISAGVAIATSIYSIVMANKLKTPSNLNRSQESATNRIQSRSNEPRTNQRVERSYGQVRNFFTMMALPYIRCEKNQQVEYSYMSAGQGEYEIDDVRDNRTLGKSLQEWSMGAYLPFQSPNNGKAYHKIGTDIDRPIFTTFQSKDLSREELDPPNELEVTTSWKFSGIDGKAHVTSTNTEIDLRDFFTLNDDVDLSGLITTYQSAKVKVARITHSGDGEHAVIGSKNVYSYTINELSIGYVVESVSADTLIMSIPDVDIDKWNVTDYVPLSSTYKASHGELLHESETVYEGYKNYYKNSGELGDALNLVETKHEVQFSASFDGTIGPFEVERDCSIIQYNLYSDALLKDKGKNKTESLTVSGVATVLEVDEDGKHTGVGKVYPWEISSNEKNRRKQACKSFDITKPYERCTIEFRRTSDRDFKYQGSVRDIVELTEMYFHRDDKKAHFGDKTTLQFRRTQTTYGVGKESAVSALTTSKLKIDGTMKLSRFFDEIICDAASDPLFGRRSPETVAQMRIDLRAARDELIAYFGREDVAYFDYCVDSENITFENFVRMVANAVYCTPYLKSTLRFSPDIDQPIDTMIFGHANKLIADEELKFSFDDLQAKKYDCVEVKWRNPANMDSQEIFFIPTQGSNPKAIDLTGVRDKRRATVHAWREWNRIRYQRYSYEFTAGLEATQMIPNQRIGIVNNVCANSLDGYVRAWDGGVNVLLSQEADLSSGGYKIALQNPQGGIGIFDAKQGRDLRHVVLNEVPTFHVNAHLSENLTVYRIAKEDELTRDSYQTQELELANSGGVKVRSVNYAPEVYSKDLE